MQGSDPKSKNKQEERPDSTGKAYEKLVEDLYMGESSDEDSAAEEPTEQE